MHNGSTSCACGCQGSNADGASYDPQVVGQTISTILYEGTATDDQIKKAYPEVMIYLDAKKLDPTADNIMANKEALMDAIATENKTTAAKEETFFTKKRIITCIAIAIVAYLIYTHYKNK